MKKCDEHYIGQSLEKPSICGVLFTESEKHLYAIRDDSFIEFHYCPACGHDLSEIWK